MGFTENFDSIIQDINAIPDDKVTEITMPVANYVQEAVNLKAWAETDKIEIAAAKLDWKFVDSLAVRAAALTEAESRWQSQRFAKADAQKKWAELSPEAYDLRDSLVHTFLYAYRKDSTIYSRVQSIAEGNGDADMILDLNTLAVVGRENPDALLAIGFDLTELDRATQLASEMQILLGEANGSPVYSESKLTRDKAYTYLKTAVDEVRACGQYLFYRNKKRYIGYTSQYLREHRQTSKSSTKTSDDQTTDQTATVSN